MKKLVMLLITAQALALAGCIKKNDDLPVSTDVTEVK